MRAGDSGGVFITADRQTGGRGRHGRSWVSPPGNLYASLALVDPSPPSQAPQLGFVAGVALARTLRSRLGGDSRLKLKWPNDAVFAGAKLAGLLLEATMLPDGRLGCVIGIGVNCVSHPRNLAAPATDLREAGDPDPRPAALLAELAVNIDMTLGQWSSGANFAAVRAAWLEMAAGIGDQIEVRTPRRNLTGIFRELDPTGRLRLATASGLVDVDAGDVFLSRAQ